MSVDIQTDYLRGNDAEKVVIALGPVEKWMASVLSVLVLAVLGWFGNTVMGTRDAVGKLTIKQEITSSQIQSLGLQLADVTQIRMQYAQIKVQTDRNTEDIKELRALRGVR